MLMYSFRFNRKLRHSTLLLLLLLAVMAAGRLVLSFIPDGTMAAGAVIKRQAAKTEEQRQQFIVGLGWQVEPQPAETVDVVIPKKFDEVYQSYNLLQKEQGMDLTRWRGKRCQKYSYNVLNHPSGDPNVRLNLLVCGGKIIGGDVCSLGLDGFMQGLAFPNEDLTAKAG